MSKQQSARDEFLTLMTQEYHAKCAIVLLETLRDILRLAKTHARLQMLACNEQVPDGHDEKCEKCEERIRKACARLPGCVPIFSSDPRGATVNLRLPSGRTNDWGNTGICVPQ